MKNIKSKIMTGIIALGALFLVASCNDDLKYNPYGGDSTSNFWKTEKDIQSAVDGLYLWTANEGIDGRGFMWFENCSDNLVTGRIKTAADDVKNFNMGTVDKLDVRDNYKMMYRVIANANAILRNVPEMNNVSQEKINYGVANAYFFRGFAYMWLAPWYGDNSQNGGIPIVTEKTPVTELDQPRAKSVLDNYDLIIADMRKAAESLPLFSQQDPSQWGRPTKMAAWGYMARAALYAAQYDEKYYDTVIEACDKIINLQGADKRSLYPDYTKLFSEENNFSSEFIFSMTGTQYDGPKFAGVAFQNGGWGKFNTWGYYQPTIDLFEAFEVGDTRRDATILYPTQHIQFIGGDIHFGVSPSDVSSTSGITFRKWMNPFAAADCLGKTVNSNGNNASTRMALPLIRFADILLMKAEALIWRDGEGSATAKSLINQIRKRAGLAENSNATKAELMNERRCELAFEFQPSRHVDMIRWGVAKETYAKPLFGLARKKTLGNLGLSDEQVKQIYGDSFTAKTYLSKIDPSKLPADKKKLFDEVYEPETEKYDGYTVKGGDMIEGWVRDTVWKSRKFNPEIHHVFPLPVGAINSSSVLKQSQGY